MSSSAEARSILTAGDQAAPLQGPGTSVRVLGAGGSFSYWVTYSVYQTSWTSPW
jgi:hypothetical protein